MAAFDSTQHPCAGPSELEGAGGGNRAPPSFDRNMREISTLKLR